MLVQIHKSLLPHAKHERSETLKEQSLSKKIIYQGGTVIDSIMPLKHIVTENAPAASIPGLVSLASIDLSISQISC